MASDPEYASGGATLVEVIANLESLGYAGEFQTGSSGQMRCLTCEQTVDASSVEVEHMRRVEGASDPADMAYVAALHCPNCGTAAVAVLRYGPQAPMEDADVLMALDDHRAND